MKVVDDENMQKSLVKRFHEKGNHRGITETFNALRREYFWNNYHNDVIQFINACHLCQINKYDRKPINLPMQVTDPVSKSMQMLRADVFKIKNNVYLTILDSFSKYAQAIPVINKTPTEIANAFIKYFSHYGIPDEIAFDNGLQFNNSLIKDLLALHQIAIHFTTANHPESQGEIERFHSTLVEHVRILGNVKNFMELAVTFYNNAINSVTQCKPVEMFFGRYKNIHLTDKIPINSQLLAEYKESIQKINDDLAQVKQKHKMKVINKQNEKRVDKGLNIGSQVYIKFPGKYSKTNAVAKGPYQVTEKLPHNKIKVKNKCGKVFEYHIDSIKSIVTGTCAPSDAPAQN